VRSEIDATERTLYFREGLERSRGDPSQNNRLVCNETVWLVGWLVGWLLMESLYSYPGGGIHKDGPSTP